MSKTENLLLEAELFFKKYQNEYPQALSIYRQITETVDTAFAQKDDALLLSQLNRMESDEGYPAFQYIGEARCLLRILHIISLENKYGLPIFSEQITCKDAVIEKYRLTLFSLRRIAFALSEESAAEAESFLLQNHLSPFAIYMIAKNEVIIPNPTLFEKIQKIYENIWTLPEKQLLKQLTNTLQETL